MSIAWDVGAPECLPGTGMSKCWHHAEQYRLLCPSPGTGKYIQGRNCRGWGQRINFTLEYRQLISLLHDFGTSCVCIFINSCIIVSVGLNIHMQISFTHANANSWSPLLYSSSPLSAPNDHPRPFPPFQPTSSHAKVMLSPLFTDLPISPPPHCQVSALTIPRSFPHITCRS